MMNSRFDQVREILLQAVEQPVEQRATWVSQACAGDEDLRQEVESLLAHEEPANPRLNTGGVTSLADTLPPPEQIGPYRILERLGEGGFGEVYVAEQTEPFQRRVALKILKRGMDTQAVLARFSAERQALALMEHPNISTILDAGATESGRPYFVMEWIRGSRITDYCNLERLTSRRRVELFLDVCSAVEHAHRRGVIHRDIKPSNILVAETDGTPTPKVIDFGIAKALWSPLTDQTLFTVHGQILGTPTYMSPEQALAGSSVDVTTDVYSLGAVLYELLVGVPAFDPSRLTDIGITEVAKILQEVHPRRPSVRLRERHEGAAEIATLRSTSIVELTNQLESGLDWIVLRALEKVPQQRYDSVIAFSSDLRRYLTGDLIEAAPPGWPVRATRRLRNKWDRTTAATTSWIGQIGVAISNAVRAQRIAEERDRAQHERERAERVADFLAQALASVEPNRMGQALLSDLENRIRHAEENKGRTASELDATLEQWSRQLTDVNLTDVALRILDEDILEPAGKTVETEFGDDPEIAARIRATFGSTYRHLGLFDKAEPYTREALAKQTEIFGPADVETIRSLNSLSKLLQAQERWAEAETSARDALGRAERALGLDAPESLDALANLGSLLTLQGLLEEAEVIRRRSMDAHIRVFGEDHLESITAIGNLGVLLGYRGDNVGAEPLHRRCLELAQRFLGPEHSVTMTAMGNLAQHLEQTGRASEAERILREVVRSCRQVHGDLHYDTLVAVINLGAAMDLRGNYEEAARYYREAMEGFRKTVGDDHSRTLAANNNLGCALKAEGKLEEAEAALGPGLEKTRELLGPDHLQSLIGLGNYGDLLRLQGRLDEASALLSEGVERAAKTTKPDDWLNAVLLQKKALCQIERNDLGEAETALLRAHQLYVAALGEAQWRTRGAAEDLVTLYEKMGRGEDARTWEKRAEPSPESKLAE